MIFCEKYMKIEWKIMRSVNKHGAALVSQILEDLKNEPWSTVEIVEGIVRLMETKIVYFSLPHFDFLFQGSSKLTKDVARSNKPTISLDEYERYGWTKLANSA